MGDEQVADDHVEEKAAGSSRVSFEVGESRDGIRYERPADRVARIVLDRADARNAQDKAMLYALNAAFDQASFDDGVSVIILAADGPHFSSGHDLRDAQPITDFEPVGAWGGFDLPGAEGFMAGVPGIGRRRGGYLLLELQPARFPAPARGIGGGLIFSHSFKTYIKHRPSRRQFQNRGPPLTAF